MSCALALGVPAVGGNTWTAARSARVGHPGRPAERPTRSENFCSGVRCPQYETTSETHHRKIVQQRRNENPVNRSGNQTSSCMALDVTALSSGQLAIFGAIATLAAAGIAAAAGLSVAWVNSRAAFRLAKETAKRDYYLSVFKTCLDRFEADIPRMVELSQMCARLRLRASSPDMAIGRIATASQDYERAIDLRSQLAHFPTIFSDVNVQLRAFIERDPRVAETYRALAEARERLDMTVNLHLSKDDKVISEASHVRKYVNETIDAILRLRIAMEDFIYR